MLIKKLSITFIASLFFIGFQGCNPLKSKSYLSPPQYNLNNPVELKLPIALDEISGLTYYPKDSSVFAITDESGILFKIYLTGSGIIKEWRFDKNYDMEDVVMRDSIFYVLISNGDIQTLKFTGDSILKEKSDFPSASVKNNEFETLYFDDTLGLVLLCKDCKMDNKQVVTAFGYTPATKSFTKGLFKIDAKKVGLKTGKGNLHLKPSAAAINPLTDELYILASANKLLVVTDRKGNLIDTYPLDPGKFNQPEGITFTPSGSLIISNEKGEEETATILIFKPLKKD